MNKELKSDLCLLSIAMFWGSTFVLMKNALSYIDPLMLLALRFFVAFICLWIIFGRKVKKNINKNVVKTSSIIGIIYCFGILMQIVGLKYTMASKSSFITGLNVVLVPIIAFLFFRTKPRIMSVIGVILAFFGLYFLTSGPKTGFNIGDTLTLISAVCFAFHITLIDKFTKIEDSTTLGVLQVGAAAAFGIIIVLITGRNEIALTGSVLLAVFITAVPATAFAMLGQSLAQQYTTATKTAIIYSMEPVFGAVFAFLIPNEAGIRETLSISAIIGCLLILFGMIISEVKFKKNNILSIVKKKV